MAQYHFHVTQIKRSAGQSAIASAAYRAGERLYSDYYGEWSDYTRKGGVLHSEILLPENAPAAYADRQTLWNAVEQKEKHKKAQLAYSFDIALQNELTEEENIALARRFVQECLVSKGMICDLAVHRSDPQEGKDQNPHFHVMATMRPLNLDGSWGEKQRREYVLDNNGERIPDGKGGYVFNAVHTTDWHIPETLEAWREAWCLMVNEAFERQGLEVRIDHRSYAEQGSERIPTVHEGPMVRAMEEQGIRTDKGGLNRWIRQTNRMIAALKANITKLLNWIRTAKEKLTEKQTQTLRQLLSDYYQERSTGAWSKKAKVGNVKQFADALLYLSEHGIETLDDLEARLDHIASQAGSLKDQMSASAQRVSDLDEMIRLGETLLRTKPIVDEMNAIHWIGRREKFQAAHETDLRAFQTARRVLKERYGISGAKGIAIQEWKKEKAQLTRERESLYGQYKPLDEEMSRLLAVRHCAEIVMKGEQSRKRHESHEIMP
ncbi:MAG: MobA/MobL family protein [Clostridia bacterium]|nr:MobA/MobL family protein [Clostridia bacterium]